MAKWAWWMLILSGTGTLISVGAPLGLLRSLRQTQEANRQTERSIDVQERIGHAEARAYLCIPRCLFGFNVPDRFGLGSSSRFRAIVTVENRGKTPACDARIVCGAIVRGPMPSNRELIGKRYLEVTHISELAPDVERIIDVQIAGTEASEIAIMTQEEHFRQSVVCAAFANDVFGGTIQCAESFRITNNSLQHEPECTKHEVPGLTDDEVEDLRRHAYADCA